MPVERFYFDGELNGTVQITGAEHHHLTHVMRIRIGEEVELVNGRGALAKAKLASISKHEAMLFVSSATVTPLSDPHLILAIPLMRPAKLELIVEKCTELGADGFFLYPAHFSEKDDLSDHQMERLQHIAISAMKQCGRLDLPAIQEVSFEQVLHMDGTLLFGDPQSSNLAERIEGKAIFVTGPEKGFFEKEIQALKNKGRGVRLHKNILRAETAPIAASVLLSD